MRRGGDRGLNDPRRVLTDGYPDGTAPEEERAVLVGVEVIGVPAERSLDESLAELARLVETAGAKVVARVAQRRQQLDPRFVIGEGKLEEVRAAVSAHGATVVVFDDELSPAQARSLECELGVRVIDRTQVILDIFAQRARTKEGRLQVELAQLEYLLPRLAGKGTELSRLGGGIGTRGPGETKLETDRRRVRRRIAELKREVEAVRRHRALHRKHRRRNLPPVAALVGYTNAGKSTLLKALTGANVLIEDKLFATLDPTIRAVTGRPVRPFLLVDTVGFIAKLPHQLVAAFRATLEEVVEADVIVHVLDVSSPAVDVERRTVYRVLQELGAGEKPVVTACNKIDLLPSPAEAEALVAKVPNGVAISAAKGWGLDALVERIAAALPEPMLTSTYVVPYDRGAVLDWLHRNGRVLETAYEAEGVRLTVALPRAMAERVKEYRLS